jgi:hypothetical protein
MAVMVVAAAAGGLYVRRAWMPGQPEPVVPAEVRAVRDEMITAWQGVEAVSAEVETYMSSALGQPGMTAGGGTYDLSKRGGTLRIRFAMNNELRLNLADAKETEHFFAIEALRWLVDGDMIYHSYHQPDFKRVGETVARATKEKYSPDKVVQIGGKALFDQLERDFDLQRLPDIEYEGRQVYVLRGNARGGDWHSLHYFDKESGIRVRMVENDADGSASLRITLKDVNLTPAFEPDHFTFTPHKDVEIEDLTQAGP